MMRRSWYKQLPVLAAIVAIHGLLFLGLWTQRIAVPPSEAVPLVVDLLAMSAPAAEPPPPPPPLPIWRAPPPVPQYPSDFLVPADESAPKAITVAAAVVSEPVATRPEPIVEARYDADYLDNPAPIYPPAARRRKEHGVVLLKVKVRPDGCSDSVLLQASSGYSRLDQAALMAVKRWKFVPAKRAGQPVESWVLVPIEFELSG